MTDRLKVVGGHLAGMPEIRTRAFPPQRQSVLKWNGWGYRDCAFQLNDKGIVVFRGGNYDLSDTEMPGLRKWMEETRGIDMNDFKPPQADMTEAPAPIANAAFTAAIGRNCGDTSTDYHDRLFRSHGHTCQEIYQLRYGRIARIPDLVVFPEHHKHVEALVAAAAAHNVCVIPFGGGTTVSGAVSCPEDERRMIVSLDTSKMNRILWIDKDNMLARVEAGVVGAALDEKLAEFGVCTGHQPDSCEFSTLGGWIATRASGMKKNMYGNIEDIVVRARLATPRGTVEKSCDVPRMSAGPDITQFIIGSEGTLGVVTEATLKIRPLPEATVFGSVVFPTFSDGVAFMRAVALRRAQPASVRLIDNEQFQFGHALKQPAASIFAAILDSIKTFYVTKIKGFHKDQLAVATLLFEGTAAEVDAQQKIIYEIAASNKGMAAGEENGKRGYFLTFVIAYLRDIGFDYGFVSESFETSVAWSRVEDVCRNAKDHIRAVCKQQGIVGDPYVSARVTQAYDAGACVYFYFGFPYEGLADPLATFHHVEVAARDEVIANGGSISHHHGVGKTRLKWIEETVSKGGLDVFRAVKSALDPQNVFGNGNLIPAVVS